MDKNVYLFCPLDCTNKIMINKKKCGNMSKAVNLLCALDRTNKIMFIK